MTSGTVTQTTARPLNAAAVIKECGLTALVMFALAVGMVAFRTRDVPGGLEIETRFLAVAAVTVLGFFGRLAIILLREGRPFPVLVTALPFTVLMLGALLSLNFFDAETADALKEYLPFGDVVVNWIVAIMGVVFSLRAVWALRHTGASARTVVDREKAMDQFAARVQRTSRFLGPVLLGVAVAFPLLVFASDVPFVPTVDRRVLDIAILVVTYVMLGWGLNIVVGLAGLLDLGYVAFYAVGAYSYALLATHYDLGFWVCLPFAGLMAATAGIILGFPVLRLRGDYLAIVTLGFGEMIRVILLNWYEFTNGPDGISGIPRPTFFGLEFSRSADDGGETFYTFLQSQLFAHRPYRFHVLRHSGAGSDHQPVHAEDPQASYRSCLGSIARRRDRLPVVGHEPAQYEAHGVLHRCHVRRLRRLVFRHAARVYQP